MSSHIFRTKVLPPPRTSFPFLSLSLIEVTVDEVRNNIKAPESLTLAAALTAIAVASQGVIDVEKPNGQVTPVSLMLLTVANSGERKSTVENILMASVREFQKRQDKTYQVKLSEWTARTDAWTARKKNIIKSVGSCEISGKDEDQRLIDHENEKPIKPKRFKMLYEDATPEALFLGLHQDLSSAGLISSEGGGVLNGRALSALSKYNSIWSGEPIAVDRTSDKSASYDLYNARLTVSLQVQDSALNEFMEKRGEKARGSGLLARFLPCRPQSTQGSRMVENCTTSWEYRYKFDARMMEILNQNLALLEDPARKKKVIKFSPEAGKKWLDVYNEIESEIGVGGRFEDMGDYASKLADNISRVAALFHFFESRNGDISIAVLDAAIDLCAWYSDEFRDLFVPPPQEKTDAVVLINWLRTHGNSGFRKNDIRQYCPNCLRNKNRLNKALEELYFQRKVSIYEVGKTTYVDLRPER